MKTLIALMALFASSTANAQQICKTPWNPDKPTVILASKADGSYLVSYHGQSRNRYAAIYAVTSTIPTRNGAISSLVKSHDTSTWMNMPKTLQVRHLDSPADTVMLLGLPQGTAWFALGRDCQIDQ